MKSNICIKLQLRLLIEAKTQALCFLSLWEIYEMEVPCWDWSSFFQQKQENFSSVVCKLDICVGLQMNRKLIRCYGSLKGVFGLVFNIQSLIALL